MKVEKKIAPDSQCTSIQQWQWMKILILWYLYFGIFDSETLIFCFCVLDIPCHVQTKQASTSIVSNSDVLNKDTTFALNKLIANNPGTKRRTSNRFLNKSITSNPGIKDNTSNGFINNSITSKPGRKGSTSNGWQEITDCIIPWLHYVIYNPNLIWCNMYIVCILVLTYIHRVNIAFVECSPQNMEYLNMFWNQCCITMFQK